MTRSFIASIFFILHSYSAFAVTAEPEYEEIFVYMRVQGIGAFEINAYYSYNNNRLYLPVVELFQLLKINTEASVDFDVTTGFLIDEKRRYVIDYNTRSIRIDGAISPLQEDDLLKTETGLYLFTGVLGRVFGLFCTFNFRNLSVELKTDLELPAIRELRLQQMRSNIERLRGVVKADTAIGRNYHLLRFGMVDWALSSTQISHSTTDTRAALGVGAELLGGEANLFLNHSTRDGFNERNQHYQWRWANNQSKLLRQVRAGKVAPSSIASIYDPLIGVSVTNAPTTYRRSFGEYTITDFTEPGWTVELYINNVIVDYQTADASGFYSFNVPLVYGTSQVMFKFYGPYGEERIMERFINIPFNFLPKGEVEYTITGGMVRDSSQSVYSRGEVNYGVSRFLSMGAGIEYLSSITTGTEIPFLTASLTPFRNLLLSGEYAHGVRSKALMSYRFPSNLMLELDYTNYVEGQQAIRFNYLEERKATLAIPLKLAFLKGFTRFSFRQNIYEMLTYNTADMTFSTYFGPVNANLSGYASWIDDKTPYIYSNLSLGFRLGRGYTLRPHAQFDISNKDILSYKAELEKRILRSGYLSLSYEEHLRAAYRSVDLSFRWDFSVAQTNLGARVSKESVTTTQGARGSIAFGSGNNYIHADNRSSIGRGGLTIIPFLDVNHNGTRDLDEPIASGLNVRINGGRMLRWANDSLIRVVELEPYASYLLELDETSLENIAWRIKDKVISINVDPNQFKKINIPVLPVGEVNGRVYLRDESGMRGLGRIILNFYTSDDMYISRTMSEADGLLTFLGLVPGEYYAKIDSAQLNRLGWIAEPERIEFEIEPLSIGDIVDGLIFELSPLKVKEPIPVIMETVEESKPGIALTDFELQQVMEKKINEALRMFIHAQNAFISKNYSLSMARVNQSLVIFVTGQGLALKGSLYYILGYPDLANAFWESARKLVPEMVSPDIKALDSVIIHE
ncbi:MAG: hypothetical protein U1C46_10975 [Bacteroidales bacterium]|nr:hypothetical protein [Bacteroidales bacterium]MDZ4205324.1 hypothetical protein [Bacteroidales bacterium]